jgi:hypothetical protein
MKRKTIETDFFGFSHKMVEKYLEVVDVSGWVKARLKL